MNKAWSLLLAAGIAPVLSGCGHLAFENAAGRDVGAKIYPVKPYLLVSKTGAKDKPIDVQVVYMPDLANPTYVKPMAGWGSSDLSLTVANGMLTSFGQKTDPKIAELIGSIGGLATSLATAQKTRAEARAVEQALDIQDGHTLIELGKELSSLLADPSAAQLTEGERAFLKAAAEELGNLGRAIVAPGARPDAAATAARLEVLGGNWATQVRSRSDGTRAFQGYLERINAVRARIADVAAKVKPQAQEPPALTLYELDNSSGQTVLREVRIQ